MPPGITSYECVSVAAEDIVCNDLGVDPHHPFYFGILARVTNKMLTGRNKAEVLLMLSEDGDDDLVHRDHTYEEAY